MFNYITGKITEKFDGGVVLENNGIGYEVYVSNFTLANFENASGEIKVYIFYHQKEDGVTLYGFCDKNEKDIFLKLISVSGVGPKGAMSILSNIKPSDLCKVIATQDLVALSSVKGIGKKTAERLVVELKDKVSILPQEAVELHLENTEITDACEVLVGLGLSKLEAMTLAKENYKPNDTAEDIISKSLLTFRTT